MAARIEIKGDFDKLRKRLREMRDIDIRGLLESRARDGVEALRQATPRETGETADSWYYDIEYENGSWKLIFCNSNLNDGVAVAFLIQAGHATRNGGWVQGYDYINPALAPIFDDIASSIWREIKA